MRDNDVDLKVAINDINKIIDGAYLPKEYADFKEAMKAVFAEIRKHETSVINGLYEDIQQEINAQQATWQVVAALVPNDELAIWESRGFTPMCKNNNDIAFLDCSIYEAEDIVNKYSYITFTEQFVDCEKTLFNLAEKNNIDVPIIFSPWSRRAVKLSQEDITDDLKEILLRDYILVWNIHIEEAKKTGFVRPDEDDLYYRYTFSNEENGLLVLDNEEAEVKILSNGNRQIISSYELADEVVKWVIPNAINLDASYIQSCSEKIWHNHMREGRRLSRIVTHGDVEYILERLKYPLADSVLQAEFYGFKVTPEKIIKRYADNNIRYGYNNEEKLLYKIRRNLPICYIAFKGKEKWITDYVEYVLSYLECYYPDFRWAGVRV